MADNFVKGVDGKIFIADGVQERINSWTMNISAPTEDVTDFGSAGDEHEYTGLANFSGTVSGQVVRGSKIDLVMRRFSSTGALAKTTARFVEHANSMWYGTVLFTNFNKSAPSQGIQTYSADWVSDGRFRWRNSSTPA
jgi:hypothetical protein